MYMNYYLYFYHYYLYSTLSHSLWQGWPSGDSRPYTNVLPGGERGGGIVNGIMSWRDLTLKRVMYLWCKSFYGWLISMAFVFWFSWKPSSSSKIQTFMASSWRWRNEIAGQVDLAAYLEQVLLLGQMLWENSNTMLELTSWTWSLILKSLRYY